MIVLIETIFLSAAFYLITYGVGKGLSEILLRDRSALQNFLAPWIGIVQTGLILILFGFFGVGTDVSCWVSLVAGLAFFVVSRKIRHPSQEFTLDKRDGEAGIPMWIPFVGVVLMCMILMSPIILKSKRVTSFTIGNNDIFDYVVTARYLQTNGLRPYIRPFGQQPDWKDATVTERVVSWQIPAPRWLSYYYLSFLSSILKKDPADLFSIYIVFLFALSLPVIWYFARHTLELKGIGLGIGFLLILANPHILYVVFNGFLPQIAATGFFICFLSLVPTFFGQVEFDKRRIILLSLFATGVLCSYPELFSFLLFIVTVYSVWISVCNKINCKNTFKKWLALSVCVILLAPYQAMRFFPLVFWHAGWMGGGWRMTEHYYLFPFQLGLFSSHPTLPFDRFLLLEWLLNPLLLFLAIWGLKKHKYKDFLIVTILPFVIAGAIAYFKDWNYRYYKNFTYIYFWMPLVIGMGINSMEEFCKYSNVKETVTHRYLSSTLFTICIFIALFAGTRTFERLISASLKSHIIPTEMNFIKALNQEPEIKEIYVDQLSFWESLWAGYYLRDKNLILAEYNPYLRNDVAAFDDKKFKYILVKNNLDTDKYVHDRTKIDNEIFKTENYRLLHLK